MERYVLEICGSVALVLGGGQGLRIARQVIAALPEEGDPIRAAIEAARPFPFRPRVRRLARRALVSAAWLLVAAYGLFLCVWGLAVTR